MNPPHPEPGLPRRHHHMVHLHLDPRHHHHVHIHLRCCHHHHHGTHLLAPAPPARLNDNQQRHPAPVLFPNTYPNPSAAPGQPEPPRAAVREDVEDLDPEPGLLHAEEEEEEDEEPVFVLTDEWAEFFAKSEAKRRLGNRSPLAAKQQKKKSRK
ncbi:uncharacterized protein [Zea mays]|uniref:Uncharacterized protein n=1 Tax=Zea mays TaxID=4577 RepID=A0A804QW15_MAIZE|nr:uncharacterized protein LOC100278154 isoform X1 [Zea mays]|eukprot:XP_008654751.1 uncharacterized protein LOC100278154 isoform X1 [Zea mays]